MNSEKRSTIVHWASGLAMLTVVGFLWPDLRDQSLMIWLILASLVVLIAVIHNLGLDTSFGKITFLPVAATTAYLTLGLDKGLLVIVAGLVIGGLGLLSRYWFKSRDRKRDWWTEIGRELWPLAHNGISLLVADWAYGLLGATPPLTNVSHFQEVFPIIEALVVYLIVYDILLGFELWLRSINVIPVLILHRTALLGVQVLPLTLAPFGAVALGTLGPVAFFACEIILLTIVIVVNRLMVTQESLQQQVRQLSSYSAMSRALRTSLETGSLLENVYIQIANLLQVKNLHVILTRNSGTSQYNLALSVEDGHRVKRELPRELDGFTTRVLQERLPLLADPVMQMAEKLGTDNPPDARAWMGVPLMASNRVLGCMYTWIRTGQQPTRKFSQSDLDVFISIAIHTGVALENALLYEAAQQHAAQLARLNQISTVMNASLNPERVLELVASSVIEVAGCNKAAIYLLETETEDPSLLLAHAQGFSPEHIVRSKDIAVPLSETERKQVMDEGHCHAMPDIHAEGADVPAAAMLLAHHEDFSAYAYLPLRAQKLPIGMLAVYYKEPHYFSEGEIELLETFANQAALAVVNARIYQRVDIQLARRVEQIVHMADISRRLSATLDLEAVFDLIIDSAMEGCNADAGVLVLAEDPELGYKSTGLNMVAWRGFDPSRQQRAPHQVVQGLVNSEVLKSGETMLSSTDDPSATGPRSQVSVPILLEGRTIGAIALESEILNAFTGDDITFVSQLAVQAAVAIRNAQLYKRAQVVRDRLAAILDASNDGLLMIDTKSRIVMTNTRMGDFWDFARGDFGPRSPDQFLADPLTALGEGLGYRAGELNELLSHGIQTPNLPSSTDLYVTRPKGGERQRFVERTATPVRDENSKFIGLLLIFRDVTEQKELEQAREDLTSMMVHDLRSPLQAVMGGMRLIKERMVEDDPVVDQATDVSTRAVKKLLNLVNNLLDLSQMERGEFSLDTSIESVSAILEDAAAELMPLAQGVDAVIRVEKPDDLLYSHIDRDMLERVVLNLLDNALKHTTPGTLVTLRAEVVAPDGDDGAKSREIIHVAVADNGPGVPDEYKEHIFNRFAQVPGKRSRRRSSGLGLAFCKMAVESHGGKIWVEDNPGGGSVFIFTLPIAHPPEQAEDNKIERAATKAKEKSGKDDQVTAKAEEKESDVEKQATAQVEGDTGDEKPEPATKARKGRQPTTKKTKSASEKEAPLAPDGTKSQEVSPD